MSTPVTVEVRRQAHPARVGDAAAWVEEGLRLAREFEGCLGGGVIRDSTDESVLHAIYRFSDERSLTAWERSEQRRRWLDAGSPLVLDARVQRRTGIEGWFDGPRAHRRVDARTGATRTIVVRSAPLRWKQAIAIWVGMYPVNALSSWGISLLPWWGGLAIPLRSALIVTVLAPLMTFVMMPAVTRVLRPWLRRNPGVIRSERSLIDALDSRAACARTAPERS
ncbi:antibiotic biosynthesis monooxygenase [Leucobacter sp. wl10]|uniref:antibiotic biosynthesis monooxygenase n=1 Tax=Leucobacter sp. wl10 TaxID=2304677 RepID=UPI000E5B85B5|nr:antibiotic biosynthesis monooxygenase [Leucobacter sp. wl10]RGE20038.1 antibiotic biosynthesis monooxygenase [Leucobacter sp. wl10]